MTETIWSIVAVVGSFATIGVIFYYWIKGGDDRQREEDARRYFDEHGHWPDEAPPA